MCQLLERFKTLQEFLDTLQEFLDTLQEFLDTLQEFLDTIMHPYSVRKKRLSHAFKHNSRSFTPLSKKAYQDFEGLDFAALAVFLGVAAFAALTSSRIVLTNSTDTSNVSAITASLKRVF